MKKKYQILTTLPFLICLVILLLNDFEFKENYGNWLTGKLSDFTGIFIFYLFLTAFLPHLKKVLLGVVALLFIIWKSPYSGFFIEFWNDLQVFQISRVIDYSDLWALTVLPLAYALTDRTEKLPSVKMSPVIPIIISCFAFAATSKVEEGFDFIKGYSFEYSKEELIQRINQLNSQDNLGNLPLSFHIKLANHTAFDYNRQDTFYYYVSQIDTFYDTIWKYKKILSPKDKNLYTNERTNEVDTIRYYEIPMRDSVYIGKSGDFNYQINMESQFPNLVAQCDFKNLQVLLRIENDGSRFSILRLMNITFDHCPNAHKKITEEQLLSAFEAVFIDRL